MEKKEYTYDVCPHCRKEVKLDAELKVQTCPNCGKHIVTCSMCLANSDYVEGCCKACPLEYLADKMNEEIKKSENPAFAEIHYDPSTIYELAKLKAKLDGDIMNTTNGHDKHLVELLNKCWDNEPWDVRGFIMKALYLRDYEEGIDKEVFTEKDWDGWESLDWNWEKYAYDYLMKVADDTDLKTILSYFREVVD